MAGRNHPYYPRDMVIPNYVPNTTSVLEILALFFGVNAVIMTGAWWYSRNKPHLQGRPVTRVKICWFLACTIIHGGFEAYFAVYHKTIVQNHGYLDQLWKEYAKADGRYVSGDSFPICVEAMTGFITGPLCLITAIAFLVNSPSRHVCQLIASVCQLYGTVLYFTTEYKDDWIHSKMWDPLYFWFYFIFMNGIWMVIPNICIWESCQHLTEVATIAQRQDKYTAVNISKAGKGKAKNH